MSLWVEFITASGYLSSRKIRARFQALMIAAIEKSRFKGMVEILPHVSIDLSYSCVILTSE